MPSQSVTLAGHLWPDSAQTRWLRAPALAVLASLFVAVCAQINVPLPLVPITMQSFAVLAVGAALGARMGAAAVILYAIEGAAGLPVFAQFKAGPAVLAGPTGGYILGFVIAAYAVGLLAERGYDKNAFKMFAAMLLGAALIYLPGVPWLAHWIAGAKSLDYGAAFQAALAGGLYPFIWGDIVKAALAAMMFPAAWLLFGRR
jgi:biotin transport system substrate-specific component